MPSDPNLPLGSDSPSAGPSSRQGRIATHLDRQADALEQLVYVLDPTKRPKKRGVARFVGLMMLASSAVLGGYEFVSWTLDQWKRRDMIENWIAVARDMQDVENAPELALDLLAKADELDPQNADVIRLRAYVRGMQAVKRLLQLDRPFDEEDVRTASEAAAEASLLEQLDPGAPDWALLRGQLAMAQREPERARGFFETALGLDTRHVLVRVRLADMHHEVGIRFESSDPDRANAEFAEAARLLEEAIELDPGSKLAWLYRGIHALQVDPAAAAKAFDAALAIDPRFELALRNKGTALMLLGDLDGAERVLHRALEVEPRSTGTLGRLSALYGQKDDYESALLYAHKATESDPKSRDAWLQRAAVELDIGTIDKQAQREGAGAALHSAALESFGKAIDLDPRSADVRIERSQAFRRVGRLEEAGADARQATELAPENPYAWNVLAEYQLEIEEFDSAEASLEKTIGLDPSFDMAFEMLAEVHVRRGDLQRAESRLTDAIRVAESDHRARFLRERSEVRERMGNPVAALEDAVAARISEPEDFELWLREARLLLALGRNAESCAALVEANQRRPDTPEVAELRRAAGCPPGGG